MPSFVACLAFIRRPGAPALARGAGGRLRQRQPRFDDVAARAAGRRLARVGRCGDRHRPDHLSLYLLEVYPNAPLKDDMARARWSQAPDDDAAAMYLTAMERLEGPLRAVRNLERRAGPVHRSRHNLKYWTDGEWLGFGCGAHSTRRWRAVEECLGNGRLHRAGKWWQCARRERRLLTADERLERRALHRPAADSRDRYRCRRRALHPVTCGSGTLKGARTRFWRKGWPCMRGPRLRLTRAWYVDGQ